MTKREYDDINNRLEDIGTIILTGTPCKERNKLLAAIDAVFPTLNSYYGKIPEERVEKLFSKSNPQDSIMAGMILQSNDEHMELLDRHIREIIFSGDKKCFTLDDITSALWDEGIHPLHTREVRNIIYHLRDTGLIKQNGDEFRLVSTCEILGGR